MTGSSDRHVVGCMTGTSIDALDVALVRVRGRGTSLNAQFLDGLSQPLDDLVHDLRRLANQQPLSAREIATIAHRFAIAHARAIGRLLQTHAPNVQAPELIAVHGQTVFHDPPVSWQLLNPWPIVHALNAPVVFDLRGADLAGGGQGAPITPLADWVLFRADEPRAIVNLGGFCNVTLLPANAQSHAQAHAQAHVSDLTAAIRGFDVCACNHLLDALARQLLARPFDEDGRVAASGTPHPPALADLTHTLSRQATAGRSLGSGDEAFAWIERWRDHAPAPDLAATMTRAIAQTIATRIKGARRVLVAGGGAHNTALRRELALAASAPVESTDALGVPVAFREAACMGVLGALCADGVPITLPSVTGLPAHAPCSGCWAVPSGRTPVPPLEV